MTEKRILIADRVRRLPREGWSWIDRRFLREYAAKLSGDAVFLYFFLTAVSDKNGLSYYSDTSLALRLRTTEQIIATARDELIDLSLLAYQSPLTQVLALHSPRMSGGGLNSMGELLRRMGEDGQ